MSDTKPNTTETPSIDTSAVTKPSFSTMAKGAAILGIAIGGLAAGCPTNDPQPAYGIPMDDDDSAMDDDDSAE